jgi:hypothetical protein
LQHGAERSTNAPRRSGICARNSEIDWKVLGPRRRRQIRFAHHHNGLRGPQRAILIRGTKTAIHHDQQLARSLLSPGPRLRFRIDTIDCLTCPGDIH